jgi:hypothetical protein
MVCFAEDQVGVKAYHRVVGNKTTFHHIHRCEDPCCLFMPMGLRSLLLFDEYIVRMCFFLLDILNLKHIVHAQSDSV